MRPLVLLVAALTLVLVGAGRTSIAQACGPTPSGIRFRWGFPANGATGVPTNVQVVVSYRANELSFRFPDAGDPGLGTDLELRRVADGELVPITSSQFPAGVGRVGREIAFVLRPRSPLAPRTPYEVLDRRQKLPCGSGGEPSCAPGELTRVSAFTTGDAEDMAPPPAPAGATLKVEALNRCDSGGCCGPFVVQNYTARWDEVSPSGAALYNLYSGGQAVTKLLNVTHIPLGVSCGGSSDPNRQLVQAGSLHVRAVDWAGNEGAEARVGVIPATVCENAASGSGCSMGRTATCGWWAMAVSSWALAVLSRRRRRRRASSP